MPTDSPRRVIIASCPICASTVPAPYAVHPEVTWVRCGCGLIYKQSSAEVESAPQTEAFSGHAGVYTRRRRRRISKSRAQIRDVLNHVRPGPLLDIGCSLGHTLWAARDLGLPTYGVEVHPQSVAWCRSQGFDVDVGTMETLPHADGSLGLVIMKHVLEHTSDPRRALREVWRVLTPGGGLFIAVPHGGYNKAVRDPVGSRFYVPTVLEGSHFIFYTPATLSRLLADLGFEVRRVGPHLLHRSAPWGVRCVQRAVAPFRWLAQRLLDGLALRKEFWIVAVKPSAGARLYSAPQEGS
jgi:SAM-dependent methyltransferase